MSSSIGRIELDTSLFPLVSLVERGPEACIDDFLRAFDWLLSQHKRFVSLHDARAISGWGPVERANVHAWVKSRATDLRSYVVAHGAIVTGPTQRSMAVGVFWGTGLDRGVTYFEDATAAHVWAFKSLRAKGA